MSVTARFFNKTTFAPNGCLIWMGAVEAKGYGRFFYEGKSRKAHRVAWQLDKGPIPAETLVCHRCDNPACVNIDHLFLGTNDDNLKDMAAKGRSLIGEVNRNSKLTETEVSEIRASRQSTFDLAKRFGMSRQHIGAIRNGSAWKHVKAPA